jgi:hypothetical protein
MSPVSNISPLKSAFFAAALLGLVALGLAIRGAAPVDVPLGAIDDYGNRHPVTAESRLTTADDYGTRNQAATVKLTTADDFGTRHITKATQLGPNDDYWTRQSR